MANVQEHALQEALERLEVKIAYLEQANAQLSDEVYRQRQLLEALASRQADLLQRLEEQVSDPAQSDPLSEKPPHY